MKIDGNFVAVVTGGSSGLGLATVKLLLSLGAKVVIADINAELGETVSKSLKSPFFKMDVTKEENVKALFEFAKKTFGKVSAVVHCAGVVTMGTIIYSKGVASSEEMERLLKINVVGTFNVAKLGAKLMSEQPEVDGERGVIIVVSSVAGIEGQRGQVIYSATKGAVLGMVLPMARDLGKYKIRVMGIAPGVFHTPMGDGLNKKAVDHMITQIPWNRLGEAEEFAKLSQSIIENSYATGTTWRLDGGIRLPYL
jgi:NAD(P)-dependent dehydrogenase (short-subunit alcohol dehydrogenase family)